MPRVVDRRASEVGTQVWNVEDSRVRNGLVGVQCCGSDEVANACEKADMTGVGVMPQLDES